MGFKTLLLLWLELHLLTSLPHVYPFRSLRASLRSDTVLDAVYLYLNTKTHPRISFIFLHPLKECVLVRLAPCSLYCADPYYRHS